MTQVVSVKLEHGAHLLWFDPEGTDPQEGDNVIVKTERGTEIGVAQTGVYEVDDAEIAELRTPLKPVLRVADDDDMARAAELARQGEEAMPVFREMVAKHELDMKPVAVEFLFGGEKAVFYFSAVERVDFRDLVRDLASRFRVRIDMRQIGVRDEARIIGGIGHCGQELCCTRFGDEFKPVSIRMAKEQDLPLNPLSISGACGRLMCCLRYEYDAYKDFKQRAPKKGATIETPLGPAKVVEFHTPEEKVKLRFEDGKSVYIPVAEMDIDPDRELPPGAHVRPCKVSLETLQANANAQITLALAQYDREHNPVEIEDPDAASPRSRRHPRRGSASGRGSDRQVEGSQEPQASEDAESAEAKPKHRRRRRHRSSSGSKDRESQPQQAQEAENRQQASHEPHGGDQPRDGKPRRSGSRRRRSSSGRRKAQSEGRQAQASSAPESTAHPRPGQHASGIRGGEHRRPRRRHNAASEKPEQ